MKQKKMLDYKKCVAIVFSITLICAVVYSVSRYRLKNVNGLNGKPSYSISRQIQYSFTITNKTANPVKNAEFITYGPVKKTPIQWCEKIKASHEYNLVTDKFANQVLIFKFDVIPPHGTKIITITADLKLSKTPNKVKANNIDLFLVPQKYVESNHDDIRKTALGFKSERPIQTAEKLFKWVSTHLVYTGYAGNERGALFAMKNKQGDCTEYMHLYAAMCRASQIPARCMAGYIVTKNSILKPGGFHNWAQIYLGDTWETIDPQNKVFLKNPSHYIAMQVIAGNQLNPMGDHHRFRINGSGLKVRMNG
ncbi:MAG: transglutaminase domain-containing protein [Desulfobacula sp.]|uniref:transglutaminase-like domain-containing protein n=1 Tax=Desulfobacula sp. TaxID=2593537 RepID=UPI0025B93597|nr:transglutaminase domain-containing protein [Desulfobacula sp.]MCD4722051.1 transglutaminase domain-containing protein [Desulfobacula sp.]